MQTGLGIAALVVAIIAVFIPVVGPWMTIVVAVLAAFAYGPGFAMGIAGIILNFINLLVLSPSFWVGTGVTGKAVPIILLGASAAALVLLIKQHKKNQTTAG